MSLTKSVTDATFHSEVLSQQKTVLVDFWAQWCGPCRAVAPIVEMIAEENQEALVVVKVNVDENPFTTASYGIASVPTMMVFKDGEVVKRLAGAKPKPVLVAELAEFL